MGRLTLRLPESLHHQLAEQAQQEGVSLNHYLVYTLARFVTAADLTSQRRIFEALRSRFAPEEAERALQDMLASREEPEDARHVTGHDPGSPQDC
ncbi:MAG: toxin-antitoxin system HicB family antitoxin [Acidobacteriota bacterium]